MRHLLCWLILTACCLGQEFDAVARLTTKDGKQWSGVVIDDGKILSVAHAIQTGECWAELEGVSEDVTLSLKARCVKVDQRADLGLFEFKTPRWAKINVRRVGRPSEETYVIAGYAGMTTDRIVRKTTVDETEKAIDILTLRGNGITGMSGSPVFNGDVVVAIQHSKSGGKTLCATTKQIEEFLKP